MKTKKFVALAVLSLGVSVGLAGCAESNDKGVLKNDQGGTAPVGRPAEGVARSSSEAKQKQVDPMQSDAYKKALQQNK